MSTIKINLNISAEEILKYYKGEASIVDTKSIDGRTVHFPAKILRPFVDHFGVNGTFVISYNSKGKCVDIKKIEK